MPKVSSHAKWCKAQGYVMDRRSTRNACNIRDNGLYSLGSKINWLSWLDSKKPITCQTPQEHTGGKDSSTRWINNFFWILLSIIGIVSVRLSVCLSVSPSISLTTVNQIHSWRVRDPPRERLPWGVWLSSSPESCEQQNRRSGEWPVPTTHVLNVRRAS